MRWALFGVFKAPNGNRGFDVCNPMSGSMVTAEFQIGTHAPMDIVWEYGSAPSALSKTTSLRNERLVLMSLVLFGTCCTPNGKKGSGVYKRL